MCPEIDRIIGKQSSMIRPLGRVFSVADYIVGTSLLADNQLTLVLDGCRLTELLETLT